MFKDRGAKALFEKYITIPKIRQRIEVLKSQAVPRKH